MYEIKPYSFARAKAIGVLIQPSSYAKYKIDVFDKDSKQYITSIGAARYPDYPTYYETHGEAYAENRRALYKLRHDKDRHVVGSRGWHTDQILW